MNIKNMDPDKIAIEREKHFSGDRENPNQLGLIKNEIQARVRNVKGEMYKIGWLLTEAKDLLDHGEFKDWIKGSFDFSYQTANNFMNVYRCCIGRPDLVQTFKASVLYQIAAPKFPKDLRKSLFEYGDSLEAINNKSLKNIFKRYKAGELDPNNWEIKYFNTMAAYNKELAIPLNRLRDLSTYLETAVEKIIWPLREKGKRVFLTRKRADEVEELLKKMNGSIASLRPNYKVVPISKKNKSE